LIVQWLTPEFGRITTVAKGARRPKSPFLGKLDLFYEADFTFSRSPFGTAHVARSQFARNARSVASGTRLLQQAAYCARLIEQTTENRDAVGASF